MKSDQGLSRGLDYLSRMRDSKDMDSRSNQVAQTAPSLKWNRPDRKSDLRQLQIFLATAGSNPARVLQWSANARKLSWDLQDGQGNVYAHGGGESLVDCQTKALCALYSALEAVRSQLG